MVHVSSTLLNTMIERGLEALTNNVGTVSVKMPCTRRLCNSGPSLHPIQPDNWEIPGKPPVTSIAGLPSAPPMDRAVDVPSASRVTRRRPRGEGTPLGQFPKARDKTMGEVANVRF